MADAMISWFTTNLDGVVSKEMIVFIISMVPILELRGGLIAAALLKVPIVQAVLICVKNPWVRANRYKNTSSGA